MQMPQTPDDVKPAVATKYYTGFYKSQGKFKVELPSCTAPPFARFFRAAPNQPLAVAWKRPSNHDDTQPELRSSHRRQRAITHHGPPKKLLRCVVARMDVESSRLTRAGNKVLS